jgi:cyanophycinase
LTGALLAAVVAVGGALAEDNAAVYDAILSRRLGGAAVCVLPTASATPRRTMRRSVDAFRRHGGPDAARGILHPDRDPAALEACGGFFFTGGDQSRIVDAFRPGGVDAPALGVVRARHRAGAVLAGTSAGAAMLSDPMIGDGTSEDAARFGVVREEGRPGVWLRGGVGLVPGLLTDQHFFARGRLGRLVVALTAPDAPPFGVGIDENTAAVIADDRIEAVGATAIAVVLREGDGARVWIVPAGSAWDRRTAALVGTRLSPEAERGWIAKDPTVEIGADGLVRPRRP